MSTDPRALIDALLRNDLPAFIQRCFQTVAPGQRYLPNWHIEAIAHHLELCRTGRIRRLIITLPPRNLKSICASVAFPAFALGHDPALRIVCASYAQDLTIKHARDCRAVMESGWYRRLFPRTRIDPRKNTESEFETTARGHRFGTSVGGTLTGRGGNLFIIDDPMKPAEAMSEARRETVNQWFDATLSSRLDRKTEDAIVIVMQRLHVDDLVGHLLEKGEAWTRLDLPAIAEAPEAVPIGEGRIHRRAAGELLHPEREPMAVLDGLKAAMGSQAFSAQYQQAPVPPGGALIRWSWFRSYPTLPKRCPGDRIVQSWDTASKAGMANDFSVCTSWLIRGKDYYLLEVLRQRLEYPELRRRIRTHAETHGAMTVLIEDAGSGTHLLQDLKREGKLRPIAIRPEADKITRMSAQSAVIEAGQVLLPASAPWLGEFQTEIMAFPYGRHDDQVDSLAQFLGWAAKGYEFSPEFAARFAEVNRSFWKESIRSISGSNY
jgi:predicted phage terminase large subunit-like protein